LAITALELPRNERSEKSLCLLEQWSQTRTADGYQKADQSVSGSEITKCMLMGTPSLSEHVIVRFLPWKYCCVQWERWSIKWVLETDRSCRLYCSSLIWWFKPI